MVSLSRFCVALVLVLLLVSCVNTGGVKIDHVGVKPAIENAVKDHTDSKEIVGGESRKKEPPPTKHGYSNKRDWPARWEQWHRYYTSLQCSINAEGFKLCAYTLCNNDLQVNEMAPKLIGKHTYPNGENRYYFTQCSKVMLESVKPLKIDYANLPRLSRLKQVL